MNLKLSITFPEAKRLSEEHEHLIGSTFQLKDRLMAVQQIVPSPLDEINKFIFFHFLLESGSAKQALDYYRVPFYDVIVIYRNALDGTQPAYMPLRRFLDQHQPASLLSESHNVAQ